MNRLSQRDPVSLLISEARWRPHIKILVDRIDDMSHEEIDQLTLPLPWYRDALHKLKEQKLDGERVDMAKHYADLMDEWAKEQPSDEP